MWHKVDYAVFDASSPIESTVSEKRYWRGGRKKGATGALFWEINERRREGAQALNELPQPQVDVAFGFLMTNWAPSRPSV